MKTLLLLFAVTLIEFHQSHLIAQCAHNDWGVYFGGTNYEYVEEVAIDPDGNAIIAGKTESKSGVTTPGAYQPTYGGGSSDAFIAKFNAAGTLLWSTYFGGPKFDYAYAISVDLNGNIYIGGKTTSLTGIATPGAYQTVNGGGYDDGFIAKFSPGGSLLWSTYFGGNSGEWVLGLDNDPSGNVYATGFTGSKNSIATTGAYQTVYGGGMDIYLAKFDPDGNRIFSTYFGGNGEDRPHDVQIDDEGNIIMAGTTPGGAGMSTPGAFQEVVGGRLDASISKWTSDGHLIWATYLGGSRDDRARECNTDASGNIYLTGFTNSANAIATSGSHQPDLYPASGSVPTFDSYLVKLDANGQRAWGTYFGGVKDEYGRGVRLTANNTVLISGVTSSPTNISTSDGFQPQKKGTSDSYLAEFSVDGVFIAGTYHGGTKTEPYEMGYGPAIDIDAGGNVYMSLNSNSSDIPNALNSFHTGSSETMFDAVLTKFSAGVERLMSQGSVIKELEMTIFPNPATDVATISVTSTIDKNATLVFADLSGKILFTFPIKIVTGINEMNIDVKSVASGVYYVYITGMEDRGSKKIIITH